MKTVAAPPPPKTGPGVNESLDREKGAARIVRLELVERLGRESWESPVVGNSHAARPAGTSFHLLPIPSTSSLHRFVEPARSSRSGSLHCREQRTRRNRQSTRPSD